MLTEFIIILILVVVTVALLYLLLGRIKSSKEGYAYSPSRIDHSGFVETAFYWETERVLHDMKQKSNEILMRFQHHFNKAERELRYLSQIDFERMDHDLKIKAQKEVDAVSNDLEYLVQLEEIGYVNATHFAFEKLVQKNARLHFSPLTDLSELTRVKSTFTFRVLLDLFRFLYECGVEKKVKLFFNSGTQVSIQCTFEAQAFDEESEHLERMKSRAKYLKGEVFIVKMGVELYEIQVFM